MTTNGTNTTEDTEMGEYDGDKVVTMLDVLQEEQDFEEDANAVLGASDDKNCSYNKGYIKRQAIYACMTCCSDAKIDPLKRAGVCLACSLTCHENHELIELYTKRNFRCDCGNGKFNSHPCQFNPNKIDINEDNKYNQNYSGLYCNCHRPYPDPEATSEDEMIQCIICEDWLHAAHLDTVVPDEPYSEMICKDCMEKNNFLHDYSSLAITTENVDVDSSAGTLTNGILESEATSEKTKDLDIEMKDAIDIKLSACTVDRIQAENKNESITNSEGDTVKDCTNKLNKVETVSETNSIVMPEIDEKENSTIETEDAKTEDSENKITNIVSENTALNPDQNKIDCDDKLPDSNKNSSVNEETIENDTKDVKTEESEKLSSQDTDVSADKLNSDNDQKTEEELLKEEELRKEEELLKEPTDPDASSDQQEKNNTELTKSNIENDKEPVLDTPKEPVLNAVKDTADEAAMDTAEEPVLDTSKEPVMDTDNKAAMSTINEPVLDTMKDPVVDTTNETAMDTVDELVLDTGKDAIDTTNVPVMDAASEPVTVDESIPPVDTSMDVKEGSELNDENKESDSSNTKVQQTGPDDTETRREQSSTLESTNTVETGTPQDLITEDDALTKNDSTNSEKDSTKEDKINSITDATEKGNNGNVEETVAGSSNENKRKLSVEEVIDDSVKRIKPNENKSCIRAKGGRHLKGATFWPSNFRQKLCTCNECLSMYKDLSVLFLIDSEDTVAAYEMLGQERGNRNSQYEKGLQALSSLDRIQQINAVTEYNKMREKLCDFLKTFMVRKEVVKEEDIKAFFAGMKPKREPDGVYFCR